MTIKVLNSVGSQCAIPEFERIFQIENEDYFIAEAILTLAAKVDGPHSLALLQRAKLHPSSLVRRLVDELLNDLTDLLKPIEGARRIKRRAWLLRLFRISIIAATFFSIYRWSLASSIF
jgi:hypothetical protein